ERPAPYCTRVRNGPAARALPAATAGGGPRAAGYRTGAPARTVGMSRAAPGSVGPAEQTGPRGMHADRVAGLPGGGDGSDPGVAPEGRSGRARPDRAGRYHRLTAA